MTMNIVEYYKALQNAHDVVKAIGENIELRDFAIFGKRQKTLWAKFSGEYECDFNEFRTLALSANEQKKMVKLIEDIAKFALDNNLTIVEAMNQRREVKS